MPHITSSVSVVSKKSNVLRLMLVGRVDKHEFRRVSLQKEKIKEVY